MAEESTDPPVAVVRLWGQRVAAVAEDAAGGVTFEYDEDFRRSGLEVLNGRDEVTRDSEESQRT